MKTESRTDEPLEAFETRLTQGLDHIALQTPLRSPGEFDPDGMPLVPVGTSPNRRLVPYLATAAAAVLVVSGLVAITNRNGGEPAAGSVATTPSDGSTTSSDSTLSTVPQVVRGVPVCGSELPITMDVPSATGGPNPGPAVYGPTFEGQFAQYWELPDGTIEVRWPADPREVYDLDQHRGNPETFDAITTEVMGDGTQASVRVPTIDPHIAVDRSTLTMTATPASAVLSAPCNILQVRYIDHDGNQTTRGYNIADFDSDPMLQRNFPMTGSDLNPLITSTNASDPPDPATVVTCGDNDTDTDVTAPAAATAADALLAFLDSGQMYALISSGYDEFTTSENETSFAITIDDRLITLITATRSGDSWSVTHVKAPGC